MTALPSVTESAGHVATPLEGRGSWGREDGTPADPERADHYPILTRCKGCEHPIVLLTLLQMEWVHVRPGRQAGAP